MDSLLFGPVQTRISGFGFQSALDSMTRESMYLGVLVVSALAVLFHFFGSRERRLVHLQSAWGFLRQAREDYRSSRGLMDYATGRGRWISLALALWLIPLGVITVRVAVRPLNRTVIPLYHESVERWSKQQPLYDGPKGMNYLPSFVPLFTPYHALPLRASDLLWRYTAAVGLAFGFWQFMYSEKDRSNRSFALVTLIGLPLCLSALSNGQANAHLGAALLLAALCLWKEHWWGAAVFVSLAVAIKPLGLAAAGLLVMAYPRLWWRVGIAVSCALALPILIGPAGYALEQYREALQNLRQCSEVTQHRFADLNGLLRTFGIPLTGTPSLAVRALGGMGLAAICLFGVRRLPGRERALAWQACSASYLMLFNPMTESNSYVIFAPAAALWAWQFFERGEKTRAWMIVDMLISMSILPTLLYPFLGSRFALAWYPTMAAVFMVIVALEPWLKSASVKAQPQLVSP